jgi:hypothetical protein
MPLIGEVEPGFVPLDSDLDLIERFKFAWANDGLHPYAWPREASEAWDRDDEPALLAVLKRRQQLGK